MAMFGSLASKLKMPGSMDRNPWGTPPIAPETPPYGGMRDVIPAVIPQKPSFFGQGGAGRAIAGHIGDALLQMNGMRPIYAPAMEDQRAFAMRQRMADTEAGQPREVGGNLVRLNPQSGQYEVVYKGPSKTGSPHYWETNDGSLGRVNPETGQPEILYKDPQPRMNFIPDGLGGGQWVAVPSAAPSNITVPTKPVGKLTPIQGGPTPRASASFR